jgi:hypothetical protein
MNQRAYTRINPYWDEDSHGHTATDGTSQKSSKGRTMTTVLACTLGLLVPALSVVVWNKQESKVLA